MSKLTKKEEELIDLAQKGGNDATLLLLDKLQALEDRFDEIEALAKKELPEEVKIEKIASKLATKMSIKAEDIEPSDEKLLELIKPLIPQIKDGKDGKTPTREELLAIIRPLIPQIKDGITPSDDYLIKLIKSVMPEPTKGKDVDETKIIEIIENDLPKLGEKIRDGLELLEEEEKLPIKAIKDLEEELKKLKKEIGQKQIIGGAGPTGGHVVKAHDLSASLDGGITRVFTMPAFWRIVSIHLSSFPSILRPTTDFTTDAGAMTVTITSEIPDASLSAGQTMIVLFSE